MQIVGAFWYMLSIERLSDCWRNACDEFLGCNRIYMYCGRNLEEKEDPGFQEWITITRQVINETCEPQKDGEMPFNYGIYSSAVQSNVIGSLDVTSKILFCLWWGLANLRYVQ